VEILRDWARGVYQVSVYDGVVSKTAYAKQRLTECWKYNPFREHV
jgi:hypothetical protein